MYLKQIYPKRLALGEVADFPACRQAGEHFIVIEKYETPAFSKRLLCLRPSFLSCLFVVILCQSWCVGLAALLQNLVLAWDCAVLQMCHQYYGAGFASSNLLNKCERRLNISKQSFSVKSPESLKSVISS